MAKGKQDGLAMIRSHYLDSQGGVRRQKPTARRRSRSKTAERAIACAGDVAYPPHPRSWGVISRRLASNPAQIVTELL